MNRDALWNQDHPTPDITAVFCDVDDFCQVFETLIDSPYWIKY